MAEHERISVDTVRTARPDGILVPAEVLDIAFGFAQSMIIANSAYPTYAAPNDRSGLLVVTNARGADEIIGLLRELGSKRSLEVAQLLEDARRRNR